MAHLAPPKDQHISAFPSHAVCHFTQRCAKSCIPGRFLASTNKESHVVPLVARRITPNNFGVTGNFGDPRLPVLHEVFCAEQTPVEHLKSIVCSTLRIIVHRTSLPWPSEYAEANRHWTSPDDHMVRRSFRICRPSQRIRVISSREIPGAIAAQPIVYSSCKRTTSSAQAS